MQSYQEKLKQITEILLRPEDEYGEIKKATDDLYALFLTVSGLNEDDELLRKDHYLPQGKAIGTVWAAMCIRELLRTKKFVRGIFLGIKQAQRKFPDKSIHIVYAGTGPFAALLMPLTTVFTSEEIKFTLLEINPESIRNLRKVIKTFGAEEYVEEIVQCDAAEYQGDKGNPIHIVVTETMQRALKKEPQVAITLNLVPQMVEGGILIPQNIIVEAVLFDPKRDMERMMSLDGNVTDHYYPLDKIFELNKDMSEIKKKKGIFPEVEVELPKDIEKRFNKVYLFTNVQVLDEEKLTYLQCSLTMPLKVMNVNWINNPVKKVRFQYVINETPGFVHKIVE